MREHVIIEDCIDIRTFDSMKDIDCQMVELVKGNGIFRSRTFMMAERETPQWVFIGEVAKALYSHPDMRLAQGLWPEKYRSENIAYLYHRPEVRSTLNKLNTIDLPISHGVRPEAVRFFIFSAIYRVLLPDVAYEVVRSDYLRFSGGVARIKDFFKENGKVVNSILVEAGVIDAGLHLEGGPVYSNFCNALKWCLHHVIELGLDKVDLSFVREVIRIHPPAEWESFRAAKDAFLHGVTIREGEFACVPIRATNLALSGPFEWPCEDKDSLSFGMARAKCPAKLFSEYGLVALLNGPGDRPSASSAAVNAVIPDLLWN